MRSPRTRLGCSAGHLEGEFRNGRGDFYDQEVHDGRNILVRFSVSDITPKSCHFEQAFSPDWGKTWEVNFIVDETLED